MNNFIFFATDLFINVEVLPESTITLTVQLSILQVVYETSLLSRPSQARLGLFFANLGPFFLLHFLHSALRA